MKYKILLSRLPPGDSRWEWKLDSTLFKLVGSDYGIHDLRAHAHIVARKEARYLRLTIVIQGEVEVACDRGLEPIRLPIQASHQQVHSWDELYLPQADEEEFFVVEPKQDEIDLTQALYDYVCLAIPVRRIRETCPDEFCPAHVKTYLEEEP
ncbi:MAG: DUF177 domain-containing protein [Bacteroidia bacterium]|nr:DUF177 domain-containing protein [Bacteroidia bacterium]MDW8236549.1 DUF177 domain-containing protein [Bacteroidia bacterium]